MGINFPENSLKKAESMGLNLSVKIKFTLHLWSYNY